MEFIVWLIVAALTVIPFYRLLPHFGINANWSFAAIIPLGAIILLWVMANRLQKMEGR